MFSRNISAKIILNKQPKEGNDLAKAKRKKTNNDIEQNTEVTTEAKKPRKKRAGKKNSDAYSYKGEFVETCLAVYDSLNIEKRKSQRELLEAMAKEMEASYAKKQRNVQDESDGIEVDEDLKGSHYFIGQAPVGTGKTYVILLLAFVSFWLYGKKTVVSTQTKVLQNQILKKDLPNLKKLLREAGENGIVDPDYVDLWTAHLVKGRDNYLCPYRVKFYMEKTQKGRDMIITTPDDEIVRISYHQLLSINGDDSQVRTESLDLDRYSQIGEWSENLLGLISASAENCVKNICGSYPRNCPYYNARFMDSPLVICNHNIIKSTLRPSYLEEDAPLNPKNANETITNCAGEDGTEGEASSDGEVTASGASVIGSADLKNPEQKVPEEPPKSPITTADNYIFDEAHHFMGYYCGKQVRFRLDHSSVYPSIFSPLFCSPDDLRTEGMRVIKRQRLELWKIWKTICRYGGELDEVSDIEKGLHLCKIAEEITNAKNKANELKAALVAFSTEKTSIALEKLIEFSDSLDKLKSKIETRSDEIGIFSNDSYESVKYEPGGLAADINKVFEHAAFTGFLSGTMLIEGKSDVFRTECGLPDCPTVKVDSPFNHENIMLWIPKANREIILPNAHRTTPETIRRKYEEKRRQFFVNFCQQYVPEYIKHAFGGVLILCTSNINKTAAATALRPLIEKIPNRYLYEQGEMPRAKLVNNFLNSESSVLVGTNSFREGFDAVGEKLTWVILDRLPYPNYKDKDMEKRNEILLGQGKITNKLSHNSNLMAFDLIQAMGRLERSISDWGTITILDPRFYWLCKEGKENPSIAFEKKFFKEAGEAFLNTDVLEYEWLAREKYVALKQLAGKRDDVNETGKNLWAGAVNIEDELPFDWANKFNLRDNIPGLPEWLWATEDLKKEAMMKNQMAKFKANFKVVDSADSNGNT